MNSNLIPAEYAAQCSRCYASLYGVGPVILLGRRQGGTGYGQLDLSVCRDRNSKAFTCLKTMRCSVSDLVRARSEIRAACSTGGKGCILGSRGKAVLHLRRCS
ncbi:hypothetical protein SDC9_68431 [bioreactor metagenome]|uniref:Uncharacterized protein n=1 Tax=bioreactor metagenome TaxID=1076179 RepID=A0A644Y236_9ZZZZ